MGANVAKHLTATHGRSSEMTSKTTWELARLDESKVSIKMETQINIKSSEKSCQVKKPWKKSTVSTRQCVKDSVRPVSVICQMIPLENIKDKENGKEAKCTRTKPKRCGIGLTKIKLRGRECDIRISKIDMTHHLQKKSARVDIERIKLPQGFCENKVFNNNKLSRPISDVRLNALKPNPRTIKERKNNEEILRDFNKDHSDDMFDSVKPSNYVSKLNLMDSSFSSGSSEETSDNLNNTPITKHILNFEGWSANTPDHLRIEVEEEVEQSNGKFSELTFVHRTLDDRRKLQNVVKKRMPVGIKKIVDGDKNYNTGCSTPKLRKQLDLQNLLRDLEPALEHPNNSQQDISIEEIEPYFDDDL